MIPRSQQVDAIKFIAKEFSASKRFALLQLPTGSGKSYFVTMFLNWYLNNVNDNANFDILTCTKVLQNQYVDEFPFMANLKGKANYKCHRYNTDCETGMELCSITLKNKKCADCPFILAKKAWVTSTASLTNFHLYNMYALFAPKNIESRKSNVLIIDEAHDFEAVFCDYITSTLSARAFRKMGLPMEMVTEYDKQLVGIKRMHKFIEYVTDTVIPLLNNLISEHEEAITENSDDVQTVKEFTKYLSYCTQSVEKFEILVSEYEKNADNWVLETSKSEKEKKLSGILLEAKPVWGHEFMAEKIWEKYDHIIFMSGTILDLEVFSFINGLNSIDSSYFAIDSTFPIKNRPLYYFKNTGKMNMALKNETFKVQVELIKKILKKNINNKGIIHCNSFELAKMVKETIKDDRLLFHDSSNREEKLKEHIASKNPTVLVSPSMETGVDLKDDLSRFQIVLKMPYPYLGSQKVKARMNTYNPWYAWKTAVDLLQMFGRSIRSETDYAETYILDTCFSDILRHSYHLLPRYITDAIKTIK